MGEGVLESDRVAVMVLAERDSVAEAVRVRETELQVWEPRVGLAVREGEGEGVKGAVGVGVREQDRLRVEGVQLCVRDAVAVVLTVGVRVDE